MYKATHVHIRDLHGAGVLVAIETAPSRRRKAGCDSRPSPALRVHSPFNTAKPPDHRHRLQHASPTSVSGTAVNFLLLRNRCLRCIPSCTLGRGIGQFLAQQNRPAKLGSVLALGAVLQHIGVLGQGIGGSGPPAFSSFAVPHLRANSRKSRTSAAWRPQTVEPWAISL